MLICTSQGGGSETEVGVIIHDNTVDHNNDGPLVDIRGGQYNLVYDNVTTGNGDPIISIDANCSSQCSKTYNTYVWNDTAMILTPQETERGLTTLHINRPGLPNLLIHIR